jgi:hypothetical protein
MKMVRGLVFLLVSIAVPALAESPPTGLDGRPADPFTTEAAATVLIFVRTDCPISNRYAPEITRLADKFVARRVVFCLVYPSPNQTVDSIRKHVAEYGYHAGILRDPDQVLVKLAKARVTPEAAVFTRGRHLQYRGRIDDRYVDFGKTRPAPSTHDLEAAIEAVLAGKAPAQTSTRAVGCFIADLK